jgi:hypothetical protein
MLRTRTSCCAVFCAGLLMASLTACRETGRPSSLRNSVVGRWDDYTAGFGFARYNQDGSLFLMFSGCNIYGTYDVLDYSDGTYVEMTYTCNRKLSLKFL